MAPRPVAPAITSVLRASSIVLTPVVFQTVMVSTVGQIEPIQLNLSASNVTPLTPAACIAGNVFASMPMLVPSRGATS